MTDVLALSEWEMVLRLVLAVALGAAIGIDREIDAQAAGFRRAYNCRSTIRSK